MHFLVPDCVTLFTCLSGLIADCQKRGSNFFFYKKKLKRHIFFSFSTTLFILDHYKMGKRNRAALLPTHLPQLQNLIKRDSKSYEAEFLQQWRHFQSTLSIFCLKPDEDSKELCELVTFMSQVAQCYPELTKDFSQQIVDLLKEHCIVLHPEVRKSLVQALILLRNKGIIDNTR